MLAADGTPLGAVTAAHDITRLRESECALRRAHADLAAANTDLERFEPGVLEGRGRVRIAIPALSLVEGTYYLDVAVHRRDGYAYDYRRGLCTFRTTSPIGDVGVSRLPHGWEFEGVEWEEVGGIPVSSGGRTRGSPADDRRMAVGALVDCAIRGARLRKVAGVNPVTVPFPGRLEGT